MNEEEIPLNEVKALLLGDGGAGKTSLAKQLKGMAFNPREPQIHGINIDSLNVKSGDTDIRAHLWDFGGQEIMHATHQFFLSKRSLYILVLDGRKDEKTEYWLNNIKGFGGDSPVLIVLNKIDQNPGFEVNRRFLQEKYPNIKGFYRLSCADRTGIDVLKEALTKELFAVEFPRSTWPASWFKVKERLENMREDFIDYHKYQDICAEEEINDEAMETLATSLNDLGVILHFNEYLLAETQVLKPEWLTGAVYKVINSKRLSAAGGLLDRSQLKEILKAAKEGDRIYPESQHKFITGMMKKFELCYVLENEEKILVPHLLEVSEPKINFDYAGALKFLVNYNFLPRSVMPRIIARLHRDIKDALRWRSGVVLENRGFDALAVVKSDELEKTINIYVTGAQRREYLAVILNTIREINTGYQKLKATERIPLPDRPGISVDYSYLLRLERRGQREFLPEKADKDYNVKELLDGIKPVMAPKRETDQLIKEDKIAIDFQQEPVLSIAPASVLSVKIKKLEMKNFRGFEDKEIIFSDRFNLLLGINGSGKTAILDALGMILHSIFFGFDEITVIQPIKNDDVRKVSNIYDNEVRIESIFPASVTVEGLVMDKTIRWGKSRSGKTLPTIEDDKELTGITREFQESVRRGHSVTLPVIAYYGTGRLWLRKENGTVEPLTSISRMYAYQNCLLPRSDEKGLIQWMKEQEMAQIQKKSDLKLYKIVRKAITDCIEEYQDVWFDFRKDSIMVKLNDGQCLPANLFSDGYRNMLAMAADIAYRMAILNPHLGLDVIQKTPGIVLIDELDLHSHPTWQRSVVEDLRRTFPGVQFVATTHSPFIVQSLKSPEELIDLDGKQKSYESIDMSIEDIAEEIMDVHMPQKSKRYKQMMETAEQYYKLLEEGKSSEDDEELKRIKNRLDELSIPFSDNPALQAFLKMERTAAGLNATDK